MCKGPVVGKGGPWGQVCPWGQFGRVPSASIRNTGRWPTKASLSDSRGPEKKLQETEPGLSRILWSGATINAHSSPQPCSGRTVAETPSLSSQARPCWLVNHACWETGAGVDRWEVFRPEAPPTTVGPAHFSGPKGIPRGVAPSLRSVTANQGWPSGLGAGA